MHTADQGIVFRDFGLRWYLERRAAFAKFVAMHAGPAATPSFAPTPCAAFFFDDLA